MTEVVPYDNAYSHSHILVKSVKSTIMIVPMLDEAGTIQDTVSTVDVSNTKLITRSL